MPDPEIFDRIYRDRVWGDGIEVPLSGPGSLYFNSLPVLWEILCVTGYSQTPLCLTDIGCGDMRFMREVLASPLGASLHYTGIDISAEALRVARRRVNGIPGLQFFQADVCQPGFRVHTNLILVKDVVFHMENLELKSFLQNLEDSSFTKLIITSNPEAPDIRELDEFHWAPVNLESAFFGPLLKKLGSVTSRHPRPDGGQYLVVTR